ncbi:MAG: glycosyltransferase [Acidobacteriota bacterium]
MKFIYFEQFDHHIAVSQHAAAELERAADGHKVRRGVWIRGMGVDASRFSPSRRSAAAREALVARTAVADPVTLLLYAGRLAPEKNLDLLLNAIGLLKCTGRFHLLIAGDGPLAAGVSGHGASQGAGHGHVFGTRSGSAAAGGSLCERRCVSASQSARAVWNCSAGGDGVGGRR